MKRIPRVHAVTDASIAALPGLSRIAASLALSPAVALHARLPGADGSQVLRLANQLQQNAGTAWVIVNDRVDVARIAGCAGVHLPSNGLPVSAARDLLASDQLVGRSTHSADEARRALDEGADYVFLGPVWSTPSHPEAPALGPGALRELHSLPVIAIGGVTPARARECRDAGAWGVAAISALWRAADPTAAVQAMLLSFEES